MKANGDVSGFISPLHCTAAATEGAFVCREEIPTGGHNLLVKALRDGKWYVLKGLKPEYRHSSTYLLLLHKEYDILSSLSHPGVVGVHGMVDDADIGPCIVMDWIDGVTLDRWLPGHSGQERLAVYLALLDTLEYIHSRQVVHRDLKPSNIMVTRNGDHVRVVDFGLADTDSSAIFKQPAGTEGYISPEQRSAMLTDQRNDIYSLGRILADMDLGRRARRVAHRCLQPIDQRYGSVDDVRRALTNTHGLGRWMVISLLALLAAVVACAVLLLDGRGPLSESRVILDTMYMGNMNFVRRYGMPGEVELSLGYSVANRHLAVPDTIVYRDTTYRVTGVANWALYTSRFDSITLPSTLHNISTRALSNTGLVKVVIPDSVTRIAEYAFADSEWLRRVTIGRGVRDIGVGMLDNCPAIDTVEVLAVTPPELGRMQPLPEGVTLVVPRGTAARYRATAWRQFPNIVEKAP